MKRTKPLRADPEKVRAWQQRTRDKALERQREERIAPLSPGKPHVLDGNSGEPRKQRATPAPVRFTAKEPARRGVCFRCAERAAAWHHWLPQQHIRVYVRGLRLPEAAARKLLRALLRDERNLSRVCLVHHDAHESPGAGSARFTAEDVPESAFVFAAELGPEWCEKLRILYPAAGSSRSITKREDTHG